MSTSICTEVSKPENTEATNAILPKDAEILRRVMEIRSSWTVTERIQRRRDAEDRFAELISKLDLSTVAA